MLEAQVAAAKDLIHVLKTCLQNVETDLSYPDGISLLSAKNDLLLSYLHHLTLLAYVKLSGRSLRDHQDLVRELIRTRVILEKIKPLEAKLKYQIEKLVRKAGDGGDGARADEADEVAADPLSFRANPAAMMSRDDDDGSGSGSDVEAARKASGGVYRPPRVAPTPYIEAPRGRRGREGHEQQRESGPLASAMLTDLANAAISHNDPYAEPTSGLAAAPSLGRRRERELDQLDAYEEANMTRMFQTKKAAKRRREDEARRAGGSQRAGFADLDEFVGAMTAGSKRTNANYERLRTTKRPLLRPLLPPPTIPLNADGSLSKKRKSKFVKALDRASRQT